MKRVSAGSTGRGRAGLRSASGPRSPPSSFANTFICTARSLRRTEALFVEGARFLLKPYTLDQLQDSIRFVWTANESHGPPHPYLHLKYLPSTQGSWLIFRTMRINRAKSLSWRDGIPLEREEAKREARTDRDQAGAPAAAGQSSARAHHLSCGRCHVHSLYLSRARAAHSRHVEISMP
jgi:hypothetical protein